MLTIRIVDADGVSGSGIVVGHFKNDWDAWDDENNRLVDAEWFASFFFVHNLLKDISAKKR